MRNSNSENEIKDDRRKHMRKDCDKTTFFSTRDHLHEGFVKNISLGGVFVESPDTFIPGEMLTLAVPCSTNDEGLKLQEPFNDEDVKMKCRVIWKNQNGIGLEFVKSHQ
ncbi:MAG: PilZ domain-containing protein [Desulfobacterales bacterium]